MREIKKKFTTSELVVMAWRSKELSANMKVINAVDSQPINNIEGQRRQPINPNSIQETESAYVLPEGVNAGVSIPKKFFDEKGELNLSKVTGPEALGYLNALGLRIGFRM